MQIKVFQFNPVGVNTYILWNKAGEGIIIDPGCSNKDEFETLFSFIERENISVKHLLITHPHFDHFYGAIECIKKYGLPLEMHEKGLPLMEEAARTANILGLQSCEVPPADKMQTFKEGDVFKFGANVGAGVDAGELEILYTPGHCEGSVSFVERSTRSVFTGDLLFRESVGRTDFPTGNYDLLKDSIYNKIFTLCDDFTIRPGHGGRSTVEYERYHNPFV